MTTGQRHYDPLGLAMQSPGGPGDALDAAIRRHFADRGIEGRMEIRRRLRQAMQAPGRGDLASWAGGVLHRFRASRAGRARPLIDVLVDLSIDPERIRDVVGTHLVTLDVLRAWLDGLGWRMIEKPCGSAETWWRNPVQVQKRRRSL